MDGWMNGWMSGWMDRWMDGWNSKKKKKKMMPMRLLKQDFFSLADSLQSLLTLFHHLHT